MSRSLTAVTTCSSAAAGSAPGETQFALDGARKDLVLIEEAIGRAGIHASLVAAVRDLYDRAAASPGRKPAMTELMSSPP